MRLFFAVEPTAPLRAVLAARCRALRRLPAGAGLRWIDPASYHMTLAFLGQVPPQRVAMLLAAARRGLQQAPVSAAVLDGLAWLPRPSRPRVLAVRVAADVGLLEVHGALFGALEQAGFAPELRPLLPHVTLARCRRPPADRTALFAAWPGAAAAWDIVAVSLFESTPLPAGARYRRLATWPLNAARFPA